MADNNFFLKAFEKAAQSVSGVDETLEQLARTNARNAMHHNCIGFYAPYENCGMTTAIVNVAAVLASKNYTVCIVDLNVEKPDIYRYLRDESAPKKRKEQTIRDKLLNNARPAVEVANPSRMKNVWYISSRFDEHPINYSANSDGDTQTMQIKDTLLTLFAELAVVYDFVLLDIPGKITDIFCISGLAGADLIYTFHDGTIRTTEVMLKNERILQSIGFKDVFRNIIQSKIASENAVIMGEDFKLVNPNSVLVMNIPYCESVAAIGQGSGVFMYQSHEKTRLPSTVRSKYRQLAEQIMDSSVIGEVNVVNVETGQRGEVSIISGMETCDFIPADDTPVLQVETDEAAQERIRQRLANAQAEQQRLKWKAEYEEQKAQAEERAERERKKELLKQQLEEAERNNAERAAREREQAMIRKARAAARGIELEDEEEDFGNDLIKTPKLVFENGKVKEVVGEEEAE